jgi:rubrerythrin
VRLYRDAAHGCKSTPWLRQLFEEIGAEEAVHFAQLTQRLLQSDRHVD